jgi:hypothetical protein
MNEVKRKSARIGVYFFSIFLILQIFFQFYNFLNNKDIQLSLILYTSFLIFICKFYYRIEDFLKKKKWA